MQLSVMIMYFVFAVTSMLYVSNEDIMHTCMLITAIICIESTVAHIHPVTRMLARSKHGPENRDLWAQGEQ